MAFILSVTQAGCVNDDATTIAVTLMIDGSSETQSTRWVDRLSLREVSG